MRDFTGHRLPRQPPGQPILFKMKCCAAIIVTVVGGVAIFVTGGLLAPVVGPALGFTAAGIAVGSLAAAAQSCRGNVASGSVISQMTSAAMKSK
ncbi:hypothetical protein K1T71_007710 [Dendrolimus kikuchii]|uniref:Uncharacterized protein n=1 Tax=Dendrolimus kikuchii TaxID=765133 RepID=A0ACC1CY58_9NEOP|nr:hypothetical protein K1T71_007710 [Dendrolimus kikuchii]